MVVGKEGGPEKVGGETDPVTLATLAGWVLYRILHVSQRYRKATDANLSKWASFHRIASALAAPSAAQSGLDAETVAGFEDANRGGLTCPTKLFADALWRIDVMVAEATMSQLQSDSFWNKMRPQLRLDIDAAIHSVGSLERMPPLTSPDTDFSFHVLAIIRKLFYKALATRLTAKNWLLTFEDGQGVLALRQQLASGGGAGPIGPNWNPNSMDTD